MMGGRFDRLVAIGGIVISNISKLEYKRLCQKLNELNMRSLSEYLSSGYWYNTRQRFYRNTKRAKRC
jgi:hypothetical protein